MNIIVSCISGCIGCIGHCATESEAIEMTKSVAREWVCDHVGRINYIDTLNGGQVENGLFLVDGTDKAVLEVGSIKKGFQIYSSCAARPLCKIDVLYREKKLTTPWWGNTQIDIKDEHLGFFAAIPCPSLARVTDLACATCGHFKAFDGEPTISMPKPPRPIMVDFVNSPNSLGTDYLSISPTLTDELRAFKRTSLVSVVPFVGHASVSPPRSALLDEMLAAVQTRKKSV